MKRRGFLGALAWLGWGAVAAKVFAQEQRQPSPKMRIVLTDDARHVKEWLNSSEGEKVFTAMFR